MEFTAFTFYLTERCNFRCSYCYQRRGLRTLSPVSIERALDYFWPYLKDGASINFYGGEPLLAFDRIRAAVQRVDALNAGRDKKIRYALTTNGSLITEDILSFLRERKFTLVVSFDGLAQNIGRKRGSRDRMVSLIECLLKAPGIHLETNSVFTPQTIGHLSLSLRNIVEMGVRDAHLAFSSLKPWNRAALAALIRELGLLRRFLLRWKRTHGRVPVAEFRGRKRRGIFSCTAGRDRMTLAPDGTLWGCHLFPDHFKGSERTAEATGFRFGSLEGFIRSRGASYNRVLSRYACLRMTRFETPDRSCGTCPEAGECAICPLAAAAQETRIGTIPRWTCAIHKALRQERSLFRRQVGIARIERGRA